MTTLTVKQIRDSKAEGSMTMAYNGFDVDPNKIKFENGIIFSFERSGDQEKTWNKLIKMGFLMSEKGDNNYEKWMNT